MCLLCLLCLPWLWLCLLWPFLQYPEKLAELLFETHEVQRLYLGLAGIFSHYAKGKTTGLVVDSGECITSTIPV